MNIVNDTGNYFYLAAGVHLYPGETEVSDSLYLGNETLKNQIDSLYRSGQIQVLGFEDSFPESGISPDANEVQYPLTYDVSETDFIIHKDDATVGVSVNKNDSDIDYGYVRVDCETGSKAGVSSYGEDDTEGMFFADKDQNDSQKFFDLKVQGAKLELDPTSVSAEDIANFLIDLGLAAEA